VATWRPQKKGRRLLLTVEPLTQVSQQTRPGIKAEAATLAPFRGCDRTEVSFAG
jgi:hypothetical protein